MQGPAGLTAKAKIFISYSRKDMAFADRLDAALKARDFETLIDREEIYAFEDWWKRLQTLIAQADTVVFVISPDAVISREALREVDYAAALNKRFAPIVCRRVDADTVPEALQRLNFVFFDDPDSFDASLGRLTEALRTDIGWIRKHTDYGEASRQWSAAGRPGGLLLRSPALENAERWIASRPQGAPAPTEETQVFIAESRSGASRRRNILTGSLAAGFAIALVLAGVAYWQRLQAEQATQRADRNFAAAKDTLDGLIFDIAQGLRGVTGMKVATTSKILERAQHTLDALVSSTGENDALLRSQGVMFSEFSTTYESQGDTAKQMEAAKAALAIAERLVKHDPNNARWQDDLSVGHERVGSALVAQGELDGALKEYTAKRDIAAHLVEAEPDNGEWLYDLAIAHREVGDMLAKQGDRDGAFENYKKEFDIAKRLAGTDSAKTQWLVELSTSYSRIGNLLLEQGDFPHALGAHQSALAIEKKLSEADPDSATELRDLSFAYNKVADVYKMAGDFGHALENYQSALKIGFRLAAADPGNGELQRDLEFNYGRVGFALLALGDLNGSLDNHQAELAVAQRLAASDPQNAGWQADLATSFGHMGQIYTRMGRNDEALDMLRKGRAIMAPLVEQSGNVEWKQFLAYFDSDIAALEK